MCHISVKLVQTIWLGKVSWCWPLTVWKNHLSLVNVTQILCYLFHTIFSSSQFSLFLERCKLSMYFLQHCIKRKEKWSIAHIVCIWCNILRGQGKGSKKPIAKLQCCSKYIGFMQLWSRRGQSSRLYLIWLTTWARISREWNISKKNSSWKQ